MKHILPYRLQAPSIMHIVSIVVMVLVTGFHLNAQMTFCSKAGSLKGPTAPCLDPFIIGTPPEQPRQLPGAAQTVTAEQLRHVVPKNAQKEVEKAKQAYAKHRMAETIDHLKNVIGFDPGFAGARNDLAIVYLQTENPGPAVDQLEQAIKTDPHNPLFFSNLALGYPAVSKLADAERAARTAVDLNVASRYPLYLLGTTLVYQHKFTDEALRCFERTGNEFWLGHLFAARILIAQHNLALARSEIQTYLSDKERQDPDPVYARIIANWLGVIDKGEENHTAALLQ